MMLQQQHVTITERPKAERLEAEIQIIKDRERRLADELQTLSTKRRQLQREQRQLLQAGRLADLEAKRQLGSQLARAMRSFLSRPSNMHIDPVYAVLWTAAGLPSISRQHGPQIIANDAAMLELAFETMKRSDNPGPAEPAGWTLLELLQRIGD